MSGAIISNVCFESSVSHSTHDTSCYDWLELQETRRGEAARCGRTPRSDASHALLAMRQKVRGHEREKKEKHTHTLERGWHEEEEETKDAERQRERDAATSTETERECTAAVETQTRRGERGAREEVVPVVVLPFPSLTRDAAAADGMDE